MRRHAESRLDRCVSAPFRSLFSWPIWSRAQLVHAGAFRLFTAGVAACARTTIRRALLEGIAAALGVSPDDRVAGAMLLRLLFGSEDDQHLRRGPASRAHKRESYHQQPQSEAMRRNLAWYHIGHGNHGCPSIAGACQYGPVSRSSHYHEPRTRRAFLWDGE